MGVVRLVSATGRDLKVECVKFGSTIPPNVVVCARCGSAAHRAYQNLPPHQTPKDTETSLSGWAAVIQQAVKICLFEKFSEFNGRASRSELWWFYLVSTIFAQLVSWQEMFLFGTAFLSWVVSLGLLVPSLAAGSRRLHDTNRSGWWQLLWLIPIIGWIILIVLLALPGQGGRNEFGDPNPLTVQENQGENHD